MSSSNFPDRQHPALFVAAMVALACAAFTFFLGTPLLVALMAQQWGFGHAQIGFVVSADTAGNTLGALAVALVIRGWPIRRIMISGMLLMMGGNSLIAAGLGLGPAIAGGLLAGLGNGVVSATAIGFLVYSSNPQRNVGIMVVGQNLYAMLLMGGLLPAIGNHWQASGAFFFVASVGIVCLPAMLMFRRGEIIPPAFREGQVQKLGVYLTLLTLYVCYAGVGVVWTFLATLAESAGMSKPFISQVLTVANFASLGACFLVQPMARHSLHGWSVSVLLLCAAGATILTLPLNTGLFAVGAMAFVGCWTLTGILVPTVLPIFDPVGRLAALTPAVLGLGYSTGSMMGGLIAEAVSPRMAFMVAAGCIWVSGLILLSQRLLIGKRAVSMGMPPELKARPTA